MSSLVKALHYCRKWLFYYVLYSRSCALKCVSHLEKNLGFLHRWDRGHLNNKILCAGLATYRYNKTQLFEQVGYTL